MYMIENLKGVYETVNFKKESGIRFYVNTSQVTYPAHWHTPLEIIMPEKGKYYAKCVNEEVTLNPGDILFIAPGTLHSLAPVGGSGSRIILQIDMSNVRGVQNTDSIITFLSPMYLLTAQSGRGIYKEIRQALLEIKKEYQSDIPFFEAAVYGKLLYILSIIGRSEAYQAHTDSASSAKNREYTEKFLRICDYINTHCSENLTLEETANMAGFSKYHFTRLFKQFANRSYYQYLSQCRIYTAEKYLSSTDYNITDIAFKSGFTSLSSFIRMFKLIKGVTPSEYRAAYTKQRPVV